MPPSVELASAVRNLNRNGTVQSTTNKKTKTQERISVRNVMALPSDSSSKYSLDLRQNTESEICDELNLVVVNCRSIRNKQAEFFELTRNTSADIILGNESWLSEEIASSEIFPPNYTVYRKDRGDRLGGGVFIAVRNYLVCQLEDLQSRENAEMIWCSVSDKHGKKTYFCSFYRPPDGDDESIEILHESLAKLRKSKPYATVFVGGDFNLPDISWTNMSVTKHNRDTNTSQKLIDLFSVFALEQIITEATRMTSLGKGNILDLLATSHPHIVHRLSVEEGISDHKIISAVLKVNASRVTKPPRTLYLFKRANFLAFKEFVQAESHAYVSFIQIHSVDESWSEFLRILREGTNRFVPTKLARDREEPRWVKAKLRSLQRKQRVIPA